MISRDKTPLAFIKDKNEDKCSELDFLRLTICASIYCLSCLLISRFNIIATCRATKLNLRQSYDSMNSEKLNASIAKMRLFAWCLKSRLSNGHSEHLLYEMTWACYLPRLWRRCIYKRA